MTDPSQYFRGRTVQEQMNEVIGYVDTRAAEVATDAIAADVAQVHQDMLDADADATAAAASAAAAAGTLANAVKKTGEASQSIDGNISVQTDLGVGQDATVGGALTVSGDGTVNGNLYVAGTGDFTGDVTVPTEATGTFSTKAANGIKIKNELDNYGPMVRTSGNQNIAGSKTYTSFINTQSSIARDDTVTGVSGNMGYIIQDKNAAEFARIQTYRTTTANTLELQIRNKNGGYGYIRMSANDDGTFTMSSNMTKPSGW